MVTDAMSKRELEAFKVSQTKLAPSDKPVIDTEKPAPKRRGRQPKEKQ